MRWPPRLLGPAAAMVVCAASCEAILDIPERETAPNLICSGPDDCSCQAPFADCREPDVCDVDTRNDATNCGACGVDCLDQACVDGACACNQAPCKLTSPQCGCEDGQACDIAEPSDENPAGRVCVQAGEVGLGEPCGGVERCAPGFVCLPDSDTSLTCRPYCDSDDVCAAGVLGQQGCGVTLVYGDTEIPDAVVCSDDCDPVDDIGCPPTGQCQLVYGATGDPRAYAVCSLKGAAGLGDPCQGNLDCGSKMGCSFPANECRRLCTETQPCEGGTSCTYGSTLGTLEIGVCL